MVISLNQKELVILLLFILASNMNHLSYLYIFQQKDKCSIDEDQTAAINC